MKNAAIESLRSRQEELGQFLMAEQMASMFEPSRSDGCPTHRDRCGLLVKAIIEVFCARWAPGAEILGVRDTKREMVHLNSERKAQASGLKHSTLRASQEGRVQDLDGFNKAKGHTAPKYQSSSSRSWVERLAEGDLKTELDVFFKAIRMSRAYKSKDLKYDSPEGGSGGIRTPDFKFSITYSQSEDDPSEFEVVRELTRLNDPALLDQDWFNEMFRNVFDEAHFELDGHIDVPKLIERVEKIEAFVVDYDGGRTHCTITMEGFEGKITITADSLTYTLCDAPTPKDIALQLQEAHVLLLGTPEMQKALSL